MTRPEGLSPINPGAPTSGQSLSLKEIERMLEELALSLVKEAHDAASRQKAMAALHKLARLKLDQRRMDLLEEEHRRRRQEMEIKRQQAENKQAKGTSKTVAEATPQQVNPGANSQAETASYHTAVHETTGTVPAPE